MFHKNGKFRLVRTSFNTWHWHFVEKFYYTPWLPSASLIFLWVAFGKLCITCKYANSLISKSNLSVFFYLPIGNRSKTFFFFFCRMFDFTPAFKTWYNSKIIFPTYNIILWNTLQILFVSVVWNFIRVYVRSS